MILHSKKIIYLSTTEKINDVFSNYYVNIFEKVSGKPRTSTGDSKIQSNNREKAKKIKETYKNHPSIIEVKEGNLYNTQNFIFSLATTRAYGKGRATPRFCGVDIFPIKKFLEFSTIINVQANPRKHQLEVF